jgi:hypothetical protein
MAETLGFIFGEYTLPSHLPAIYITDSNNARTLQRNIKNIEDFTHRKKIRKIKQGINYSIANHLEYLTKNGLKEIIKTIIQGGYMSGEKNLQAVGIT